jgi:hypothetical protein
LLDATSNPFCLSASEALLAATRLCAQQKCIAVVDVLPQYLPSWILLKVERGSIAVAAKIKYDVIDGEQDGRTASTHSQKRRLPVVLFRLACDLRTGSFIATFSRSTPMLQYLACNDVRAGSDTILLRGAAAAQSAASKSSRNSNNRPTTTSSASSRAAAASSAAASSFISGRAVRDAFESLIRSMNVLGQRTGVGIDTWNDNDDMSALLRRRAIQSASADVRVSLTTCCGMAAVYGMAATAMGTTTGVQPTPDMAGGKLESHELPQQQQQQQDPSNGGGGSTISSSSMTMLPTPPLTVLLDQKIVEESTPGNIDSRLKQSHADQKLFGICCSVSSDGDGGVDDDETGGLILHPAYISVRYISPSSSTPPTRTKLVWSKFAPEEADEALEAEDGGALPSSKRLKTNGSTNTVVNGDGHPNGINGNDTRAVDLMTEVERFASILSKTIIGSQSSYY